MKTDNIKALQFFQIFRFGTLVLTGILFSKSLLTTTQIGIYETLIFLGSAVTFFWINGIIQGYLSLKNEFDTEKKKIRLFNVFLITLSISTLLFLFFLFFSNSVSIQFAIPDNNYLTLFSIYLFLITPSYLIEYIFLSENKPISLIVFGGLSFLVQLLIVTIPPFFSDDLTYPLYGLVIASAIRMVFLLFLLSVYSKIKLDGPFCKKFISIAFPLSLSALLSGSGDYIDGLIINHFYDASSFAIFRFGAREFPIILLMATALSNAMIPELKDEKSFSNSLQKLKKQTTKLMHVFFPISVILVFSSHHFFPLLFNEQFKQSATIFNIYLLLITSRLLFPQTLLIAMQKTRIIVLSSFLEILINVITSLFLMKYLGLAGIALGTIVSSLFQKILLLYFLHQKFKIQVTSYTALSRYFIYSAILVAAVLLVEVAFFGL